MCNIQGYLTLKIQTTLLALDKLWLSRMKILWRRMINVRLPSDDLYITICEGPKSMGRISSNRDLVICLQIASKG